VLSALLFVAAALHGQQWNGAQNATGTIHRTGLVGIGTSSPQDQLHLFRNSVSTSGVLMGNSLVPAGRRGFLVDYHSSGGAELWNFENTDMWFGTNNSRQMTLKNNGRVGIGTANPADVLHLFRGSAVTTGILMGNSLVPAGRRGFLVDFHSSGGAELWNFENSDMWFGTNGLRRMTIKNDGRIIIPGQVSIRGELKLGTLHFVDGGHVCAAVGDGISIVDQNPVQIGVCDSAAENVPTIDDGFGYAEAGDLVSVVRDAPNPYGDAHRPFVVAKTSRPCDADLIGVIASWKGGDGRKLNEHYLPMAIYGYFPVKVTTEGGPIKRGDPITSSSKAGHGMKATQACRVVGYALEDADEEGVVQVFAHLGEHAAPAVAALEARVQELQDAKRALLNGMEALRERLTVLERTAAKQETERN
jgi:hypothetical protein